MQFGTFIPQGWRVDLAGIAPADQWPTMKRVAWQAEQLGFDSIWVYDHFHTVPVPTQEPTYEAWTLMASLAAVTERVRLGQMCTCNGYRSPSYLAKVAASIDVISNGRVEMGIGGGWYEHEYNAYGYPFPKPSVRLGELDEAVSLGARVLETHPEEAGLWWVYADPLQRSGKLTDALTALDRVKELDPQYPNVGLRQGKWLLDAGRTREAVAALQALATTDPAQADAAGRMVMAQAYAKGGGDMDKLESFLRTGERTMVYPDGRDDPLEMSPEFPELAAALDEARQQAFYDSYA